MWEAAQYIAVRFPHTEAGAKGTPLHDEWFNLVLTNKHNHFEEGTFKDDGAKYLSKEGFTRLLAEDFLFAEEIQLYKAVMMWGKERLRKHRSGKAQDPPKSQTNRTPSASWLGALVRISLETGRRFWATLLTVLPFCRAAEKAWEEKTYLKDPNSKQKVKKWAFKDASEEVGSSSNGAGHRKVLEYPCESIMVESMSWGLLEATGYYGCAPLRCTVRCD
jgi:hypothetical protein